MTQPHVVLLYQRQGGQIFLTAVREHVVADGCAARVHRVLLKSKLAKNKQTDKQNQTLRFIFEKRKELSWGCFQTLHHFKRKECLFFEELK